MAVRNAVSAATNTFAAISKILFFIIASFFYVTQISLISQIFNPLDYFYVRLSYGVGSESWGLTQL